MGYQIIYHKSKAMVYDLPLIVAGQERGQIMSKSKELQTITAIVKDILEHDPDARNSDEYLYLKVCAKFSGKCMNLPFWKVFLNRKAYGLPSYETVGRARRKLQETHPEFAGNSTVEAHRMLNEEVFKDYARKVQV